MKFEEYRAYDALGLAELVASGEVTAAELLDCALGRAEAVNPRLNAIIHSLAADARDRLKTPPSGPFAGVPFLIKDETQDYAGLATTEGSRALTTAAPEHSSYVHRALAAGLNIFGKTNTPELALKGITEPAAYGVTRNPWDMRRTPGGSSGGAAAAVAAGIVPMAGGNDGGGSIRIPAAYCGLFGLRPSRGRVPVGPAHGEVWEGASSDHVLTRSVRDSAAMLDVLSGADRGAPFEIRPPVRPYRDAIQAPPQRLRIAVATRSPLGRAVDPDCIRAVEVTVRLLEELGHQVEEAAPAIDGLALARCYMMLYFGQSAATVAQARERDFELDTRALAMLGRAISGGEYVAARRQWNAFARSLGAFFDSYDLYLTPTVAAPPAKIGELATPPWQRIALRPLLWLDAGRLLMKTGIVDQLALENLERTPFTQLANLTGVPAMSVPLHWSEQGLPVGSQFIAPFGQEALLLQLAAQLEQAAPWFERVPEERR